MLLQALSLTVALVPGVYRWWSGRTLRGPNDDPALAERWWALRTRATQVSFAGAMVAAAIAVTLDPPAFALVVTVLMLGSVIGGFPARRAVFGESWSLGSYLLWCARLAVGFWGFWIALCAAPSIVPAEVTWAGPAAALLLLLWYFGYGALLRWSVSARRFDPATVSPDLAAGFAKVLDGSTAPRPFLWRAGPPESMIANAVALPAIRKSSVMFSNALLEALSPAETTAVLAHEMGHLEHYTRRRLLWMSVSSIPLIAVATLVLPRLSHGRTHWVALLWPLFVFVSLSARMRLRQKHETASDRRAVELCGDAEALASGLTKIHALGRVPRRFSAAMEQRATHPSLARRLAAIRGMSTVPAAIDAPLVFQGADRTSWVVLEPGRIRFLTGVVDGTTAEPSALITAAASAIAVLYSEIRELRVVADASDARRLSMTSSAGASWSMTLRPDSVAHVQAALDRVDHLITPATPQDAIPQIVSVSLSAGVALAGVASHSPTLIALGVITALTPSPGACVATGLGAVIVGAASLLGVSWIRDPYIIGPLTLALGVIAIAGHWRWRPTALPQRTALLAPMLALATAIAWLAGALLASNLLALHRLAATNPSGVVAPAALGGALWCLYPTRRQFAAAAWMLALVAAAIASAAFVRIVVRDPLIAPMGAFTEQMARLTPIANGPAPDHALDLAVSPDGRHFVAALDENDEGEPSGKYVIGAIGEPGTPLDALDAQFLDNERVLILSDHEVDATIGLYLVSDLNKAVWQRTVATRAASKLLVDSRSHHWRVVGYTRKEAVRIDGDASGTIRVDVWNLVASDVGRWIVGSGPEVLGLSPRASERWERRFQLFYGWDLQVPMYPQSLGALDRGGFRTIADSDQDVTCRSPLPGRPTLCFASDGGTTRVWQVDGTTLTPVGTLAGDVTMAAMTPGGEVAAWRSSQRFLIDAEHQVATLLPRMGNRYAYWTAWTSVESTVGALVSDEDDRVWIRTYARH